MSSDESFEGFEPREPDDLPFYRDVSDIEVSDLESSSDSDANADDTPPDFNFIEPQWVCDPAKFTHVHCDLFTQPEGPNLPANFDVLTATPLDYFALFFTDLVFGNIVRNSNKYSVFRDNQKRILNPNYISTWVPTNVAEMKAYFGLNIIFGVTPLCRVRHYWSANVFLGNEGVKKTMPIGRFEKLSEHLHVSDRNAEVAKGNQGHDKLAKIRPLITSLLSTFPKYMHASQHQAIDEGMIAFKGRVSYLQFCPFKPCRRGIKTYMRTHSNTGYLYEFEVYLGKKENKPTIHGVYFDVVARLVESLHFKNHKIYFDNLYTSVPLCQYLLDNGIYSCGTLRSLRKFIPNEIKKPSRKLGRGEHIVYQDTMTQNMTVCVWKDTKLVRFLSTLAQPNVAFNTPRRVGPDMIIIPQPNAGKCYNDHMQGVDVADSLRRQYKSGRFSKKVWKYMLWFLVDVAGVNAWLLYKQSSTRITRKKNFEHLDFLLELGTQLISGYSGRTRMPSTKVFVQGGAATSESHANVHLRLKRSRRCYHHKTFKPNGNLVYQTVYGCQICQVSLCKLCHADFHSKS